MKASIHGYYGALISKDVDTMLSFCSEDVTLDWESFTFRGRSEVKAWAEEFGRIFSEIMIVEIKLEVQRSTAKHDFIIVVSALDGRKGLAPAMGTYSFNEGKIQHVQTILSWDLIFSAKDNRLNPENSFVRAISALRFRLST